jgi:hypothetical protein
VRSWVALLAAVSALTLVAGCTSREAGTATADPTSASTPKSTGTTSGSATPTVEIPPPPKELRLDGIDPCTLFTPAQRAELKVDHVRTRYAENSPTYKDMQECVLDVTTQEPFLTYSALVVTDEDVSIWLTGKRNVDAKLISIGGYPAAQFSIKGTDTNCAIAVGVAKGQYIWAQMDPISEEPTYEDLCKAAKRTAEMSLQTLQTLK